MKKIRWDIVIVMCILSLSIIHIGRVGLDIMRWAADSKEIKKQIDIINEVTKIEEVPHSSKVEIIDEENNIPEEDPYWDYIKTDLIDVDFTDLKKINYDTKGWINVKGTNINYPFVQALDNEYYLNHSFNKSYNLAGWVFMDYRNTYSDKNTILYAHGRADNSMFGSLRNVFTNGWLNNPENYLIRVSIPTENSVWQIFSLYRIPTTNDYLQNEFLSDGEFLDFANMLKNRSYKDFNVSVNKDDKILTLSTCYDMSEKVVVHAKLIKREIK